jgi:hypothetical protein
MLKLMYFMIALTISKIIKNKEKIIYRLIITEVMPLLNIRLKIDKELIKKVYKYLNIISQL